VFYCLAHDRPTGGVDLREVLPTLGAVHGHRDLQARGNGERARDLPATNLGTRQGACALARNQNEKAGLTDQSPESSATVPSFISRTRVSTAGSPRNDTRSSMDLALALHRIWRRKLWLIPAALAAAGAALSVAYHVSLFPPKAESKSLEFGTASTELLVDSAESSLAQLEIPLQALSERAAIYAELLRSEPVRRRLGAVADISWQSVAVDGSTSTAGGAGPEPTETERAAELEAAGTSSQVHFRVEPEQPIIRITTQGRTAEGAAVLAQAAADALIDYIDDLQREQGIAGPRRVDLVQIGQPVGGVVNETADVAMAAVAGIAVFGACCLLILFIPHLVGGLRAADALDARLLERTLAPESNLSGNGRPSGSVPSERPTPANFNRVGELEERYADAHRRHAEAERRIHEALERLGTLGRTDPGG
jgi:hypothetical protein